MAKRFPGFAELFSIHDPVSNRPYRGQIDWDDVAVEISRAEVAASKALPVTWAMGSGAPSKIIWTTSAHPVIVHATVLEVLQTNRFTGWTSYPAVVSSRQGTQLPDYFVLGISGRCGPVDLSKSPIELREYPGGWVPSFRGHYFVPDTWDGSDLFMHAPDSFGKISLNRFIADPVRRALAKARISNVRIERLTEVTVDASVYTIGLAHLLPSDFHAKVSAAYIRAGVPRPSWI